MTDVRKVLERLDEAKVMKLLTMSGLDQKAIHACTYSSWEDDTIIERASTGLMGFVHLIVRETLASISNEHVGEEEMAEAIRSHFKEMGMQVVVSSDGIERVYYSGFSLVSLARAILSRISLRSGVTKENEEAARLHRKAFNIVSALAVTPIAEWASKAEINSCLDDFRPPLPTPTPPEG